MPEQLIFHDEFGQPFSGRDSPEEQIIRRIREFINSGRPFRFEDCLRGVATPDGKDRRGYSGLIRPFILSGEISKISSVTSSEPKHHWGWKTRWIRSDRVTLCDACGQPTISGGCDAA